jgi:ADP-ribose pyrophosphatase
MIHNYRYPVDEWCLELPACYIDDGENPEQTACRELEEETGYLAKKLPLVGWYYPSSTRSNQKSDVAIANAAAGGVAKREKTELQKVVILPKSVVYQKLFNGK